MAMRDDARLADAQRQGDQDGDREDRQEHVEEQFVRFLLRGLAVVARDRDLHVVREEPPARLADLFEHLVRDDDGVLALALGHGDRHGRAARRLSLLCLPRAVVERLAELRRRAGAEEDVVGGFLRAVLDAAKVAQVNGTVVEDADHDAAHVIGALEEPPVSTRNSWFPEA